MAPIKRRSSPRDVVECDRFQSALPERTTRRPDPYRSSPAIAAHRQRQANPAARQLDANLFPFRTADGRRSAQKQNSSWPGKDARINKGSQPRSKQAALTPRCIHHRAQAAYRRRRKWRRRRSGACRALDHQLGSSGRLGEPAGAAEAARGAGKSYSSIWPHATAAYELRV